MPSKPCTVCSTPRDVLVRCQIDASGTWHFVCPGTCWKQASGGVIDGDGAQHHAHYRYGGMWKNKHEAVTAKKPKKKQGAGRAPVAEWSGEGIKYTRNDKVKFAGRTWMCRKSHVSQDKTPESNESCWKEMDMTTAVD